MLRISSAVCAFGAIVMLLLAPFEAEAKWAGGKFGFRSFRGNHLGAFYGYPLFGASTPYATPLYAGTAQPSVIVEPATATLPVLTCQHSEANVTVPAEDGGTREIRITRC